MATDISASIVPLHQPRPKTAAERAKAYRARKKAALPAVIPAAQVIDLEPAPCSLTVTPRDALRHDGAPSYALIAAALALGATGIFINAEFSHSLGATNAAGWAFTAIGIAADIAALFIPSRAAALWQARQRAIAAAGWIMWAVVFAFALMSAVGFSATNISDVTQTRASRVTPAIETAQAALTDALAARDRECKGGVGRFCREREATVVERQAALDAALRTVAGAADPQTEAATKLITWVSRGAIRPSADDFAMIRLFLLTLLPQAAGILLMVGGRRAA